jgi:hypothetical protein
MFCLTIPNFRAVCEILDNFSPRDYTVLALPSRRTHENPNLETTDKNEKYKRKVF